MISERTRLFVFVLCACTLTASLTANLRLLAGPDPVSPGGLTASPTDRLPALTGDGLDGAPVILPSDAPSFIYLFTDDCRTCASNQAVLRAIANAGGDALGLIEATISTKERSRAYIATAEFPGRVVFIRHSALNISSLRQLNSVPQLIAVDGHGVVLRRWTGVLSQDATAEAVDIARRFVLARAEQSSSTRSTERATQSK